MTATGSPAITPPSNGPITDAQVRSYVLSHRVPHALSLPRPPRPRAPG
jgi:hypothetical protein